MPLNSHLRDCSNCHEKPDVLLPLLLKQDDEQVPYHFVPFCVGCAIQKLGIVEGVGDPQKEEVKDEE